MKNTKIEYGYRDGNNYKTSRTEILTGESTDADIQTIMGCLEHSLDDAFIPEQVGLDGIQDQLQSYDSADHNDDTCWHEMGEISVTEDEPTIDMSIKELVANFKKAKGDWNSSDEVGHILDSSFKGKVAKRFAE